MELTKADAAQMTSSAHAYTPNTPHKYTDINLQAHVSQNIETHDVVTTMSYPEISMHYLYTLSHTGHAHACTQVHTHTPAAACSFPVC